MKILTNIRFGRYFSSESDFLPEMDGFNHTFPALRGAQAGAEFYVAMCPMRLLPKLFVFDDDDVPPELRAQRTLNRHRVPEIARYLVQNRTNYVVSALTASVDQSVGFTPLGNGNGQDTVGTLELPMDARLLINDGQHRRARCRKGARRVPGTARRPCSHHIFRRPRTQAQASRCSPTSTNTPFAPSDSLSTLYDRRDACSELARYLAFTVDGFKDMTEMERSSPVEPEHQALHAQQHQVRQSGIAAQKDARTTSLPRSGPLPQHSGQRSATPCRTGAGAKERKVAPGELRRDFVHSHGVALSAIAAAGADLVAALPEVWHPRLCRLAHIDWSRSNHELWEGRAMQHGRISKAKTSIRLTANLLKTRMGLDLTAEEQALERTLTANHG